MYYPEIWHKIPGFETYQVNRAGQVKNKAGQILKRLYRNDRPCINLYSGGKHHHRLIAHLVLEAFEGPQHCNCHAIYKDGNVHNCHASNLLWSVVRFE